MREGIPARVSEIDPKRFWVWVSNSVLVQMLRKSQRCLPLPAFVRLIPRIRSPYSPHMRIRSPPCRDTSEACRACPATRKDSSQAAEYCQLLSAFSHRHPRTPDRRTLRSCRDGEDRERERVRTTPLFTLPFLPCGDCRGPLGTPLVLGPIPRLLLDSPCSAPTLPPGRTRSCTVFSCLPWPAA